MVYPFDSKLLQLLVRVPVSLDLLNLDPSITVDVGFHLWIWMRTIDPLRLYDGVGSVQYETSPLPDPPSASPRVSYQS